MMKIPGADGLHAEIERAKSMALVAVSRRTIIKKEKRKKKKETAEMTLIKQAARHTLKCIAWKTEEHQRQTKRKADIYHTRAQEIAESAYKATSKEAKEDGREGRNRLNRNTCLGTSQ